MEADQTPRSSARVERQDRRVEVCFSPRQFDLYKDEFHTCVVIDVLRATSAICTGLAHGVDRIIPVPTVEQARALQAEGCIAAAERNGQIVDGFDFGNSPRSYMSGELKGKTVALTTTNGTKAIDIARGMPQVAIGSINNLDAICTWLMQQPGDVLLLCSGWKDKFNLEDTMCAGAIADNLIDIARYRSEEDSTIAAKHLFMGVRGNIFSFLKASSHRRRLRNLNLGEDIKYCLTPNTVNVVPVLYEGALVDSRRIKEGVMTDANI
jgi:2-phosphosulfolactate phosphatase